MGRNRRRASLSGACLAAGVAVLLTLGMSAKEESAAPAPAEPSAEFELDADALEIAKRAFEFLREQQRFSFRADLGYEVVQQDGEKLEFGSVKTYTVKRPESVRVETEER